MCTLYLHTRLLYELHTKNFVCSYIILFFLFLQTRMCLFFVINVARATHVFNATTTKPQPRARNRKKDILYLCDVGIEIQVNRQKDSRIVVKRDKTLRYSSPLFGLYFLYVDNRISRSTHILLQKILFIIYVLISVERIYIYYK